MTRITALLCLITSTATSSAQPAGAQAEVLFREGRDLMAAGKTAEACTAFEQSQKLEPTISTLMNLAGCREKLGQLATAWGLFLEAERQTRSATATAGRQLHDVAQSRAKKLETRVSKLAINVPEKSSFDGLEVTRNEDRVNPAMWNRALPVDGGTYIITARAPGSNDWSTKVTVSNEGDIKTVEIPDLRHLPRDFEPATQPKPTTPPTASLTLPAQGERDAGSVEQPSGRRSKAVPVAISGVAVAMLGGAIGLSLWANSTYDDAKAEMTDQSRRDSLYDSANTRRYFALGLGGAGVLTGGAALWLFLRSPDESPSRAAATSRQLFVTPTGVAMVGVF